MTNLLRRIQTNAMHTRVTAVRVDSDSIYGGNSKITRFKHLVNCKFEMVIRKYGIIFMGTDTDGWLCLKEADADVQFTDDDRVMTNERISLFFANGIRMLYINPDIDDCVAMANSPERFVARHLGCNVVMESNDYEWQVRKPGMRVSPARHPISMTRSLPFDESHIQYRQEPRTVTSVRSMVIRRRFV